MKQKKCKSRSRPKNVSDGSCVTRNGSLIRKPLTEMLIKKGIKGLTNGEHLLVKLLKIGVKKVKVVNEVRKENRMLQARMLDFCRR